MSHLDIYQGFCTVNLNPSGLPGRDCRENTSENTKNSPKFLQKSVQVCASYYAFLGRVLYLGGLCWNRTPSVAVCAKLGKIQVNL